MTTTTDRRVVEIDVKTARGMHEQIKRAADSVNTLEKGFSSLKGIIGEFAAGLAGAFTVGAFVSGIKGSIDAMEQMGERAQSIGIATEALSALSYQAEQTSISAEELDKGLVKLNVGLTDLGKDSTTATKALEKLGIEAGTDTQTALEQIADAFQSLPDGAEKTALAVDLFGKSGAKLIPMLNEGSEGMKKWGDEARRLGLIVDGEAAAAAGELNDQIGALRKGVGGMIQQLTIGLLPSLLQIVEAFKGATESGGGMNDIGKALGDTLKFATGEAIKIAGAMRALGTIIGGFGAFVAQALQFNFREAKVVAEETARDLRRIEADVDRRVAKLNSPVIVEARKQGTGVVGEGKLSAAELAKAAKERERLLKEEQKNIEKNNAAWVAMIDTWIAAEKAEADVINGGKSMIQMLDEQQKRVDQLTGRAAKKQLAEDFTLLDDALTAGRITFDEWAEGLRKITGATGKATDEMASGFEELGKSIQQSIEGWSSEATDAVLDFVTGTEKSFEGMVEGILRQFAKMAMQKLVFDQLFSSIGGGIGKLFATAHGAAFGRGGQALALASGGVVSGPTPFAFAGGVGVMGEAGPEAIMPLKRNSAGQLGVIGGGDVTINVVNRAPGVDVAVERSGNAEREITVLIQQAVTDGFAKGRFDGVMGATYGLNRRGR